MPRVYLGLGSNIAPRRHLELALDALSEAFGLLELSPVYESAAVGFAGDNFLNLVVRLETDLTVGDLARSLRAIEDANHRRRGAAKYCARTLDIDILTYGDWVGTFAGIQLPRDEILRYAFVLRPLADLAPEEKHPALRRTYRQLAGELRFDNQRLWPVAFDWPPATS